MWQERADYGHFFYRIPNGESAADAYDRISGFNESLWRQFGEDDCASVCVLGASFTYGALENFCDETKANKRSYTWPHVSGFSNEMVSLQRGVFRRSSQYKPLRIPNYA